MTGESTVFEDYFEPLDKHFLISVYSTRTHMFVTVFQDITQAKKIEERLRENEEKFRLLYYTTPDAVNINRLEDGLYVDVNDHFLHISGYSRAEVIGKTSIELGIWNSRSEREKLARKMNENGLL